MLQKYTNRTRVIYFGMPKEARQTQFDETIVKVVGVSEGCLPCGRLKPVLEDVISFTVGPRVINEQVCIRFCGLEAAVAGSKTFETRSWIGSDSREQFSHFTGSFAFTESCPEGCRGEKKSDGSWILCRSPMSHRQFVVRV